MKIKVVTVGKLKEKYLKDGIAEYTKRLSRFTKVEMVELLDEKTPDRASDLENPQLLEKEGNPESAPECGADLPGSGSSADRRNGGGRGQLWPHESEAFGTGGKGPGGESPCGHGAS